MAGGTCAATSAFQEPRPGAAAIPAFFMSAPRPDPHLVLLSRRDCSRRRTAGAGRPNRCFPTGFPPVTDGRSAMSQPLSLRTLATLPAAVARPSYAREDLRPGIVHFGVGNFHRAHQAVYLDDLFNAGNDRDWAMVGAGVLRRRRRMRRGRWRSRTG